MTDQTGFLTRPMIDRIAADIEAIAAAELVPRWRRLTAEQIRDKGVDDPVTEADLASEARLRQVLATHAPGTLILGEEGDDHAQVMSRLRAGDAGWVIDPLDGTRPFVQGRRGWGILVAYVAGGQALAGWMHDPLRGLTACGGPDGAVLRETVHGRLPVTRPLDTRRLPAVNTCTIMDDYGPTPSTSHARERARALGWTLGAYEQAGIYAAFELLLGRTAFCICNRMRPWDFFPIAGTLRAAGGAVCPFDRPVYPIDGGGHTALVTRSPDAAERLLTALKAE